MIPTIARGRWIRNRKRNRVLALIWGLLAAGTAVAGAVFLAVGILNHNIGGGLVLLALSLIPALPSGRFPYGCVDAGLLVTAARPGESLK